MNKTRLFTILGLIFVGVVSRLIPHPPNFTSVNSIALLGGCFLGSRILSLGTVFSVLMLTDLIFGHHSTMIFVYGAVSLIVCLGFRFRNGISLYNAPLISFAASSLFYLISNFGVWLSSGMYERTLHGLTLCYVSALPFFGYQVLGDMSYGVVLTAIFLARSDRISLPRLFAPQA